MSSDAAAAPLAGAPADGRHPHPCRNCGADAPGAYCPACGQETAVALPRIGQFLRDAAGRYVAWDGRLWRTLLALLFRPGFLTREYFAGRRRRYIRPGRLFLVLSLALFAVLRLNADSALILEADQEAGAGRSAPQAGAEAGSAPAAGAKAKAAAPDKAGKAGKAETAGKASAAPEAPGKSEVKVGDDGLRIDLGDDLSWVPFEGADGPVKRELKRRIDRFNRLPREERIDQVVAGAVRYGPYAMIALLPAYALLLQLVYLGRRRRYPSRPRRYAEHLVFGAHNHAFLFLALMLTGIPAPPLRAVVIPWIGIYFLWSMKAVYGGRWSGVAARALVITVGYGVLFALAVAGLFIAAVLVR